MVVGVGGWWQWWRVPMVVVVDRNGTVHQIKFTILPATRYNKSQLNTSETKRIQHDDILSRCHITTTDDCNYCIFVNYIYKCFRRIETAHDT